MFNLKVLSTAAILALVVPAVLPTESFAQNPGAKGGSPRGAGMRAGGAPGARFNGAAQFRGASRGAPAARFNNGGNGGNRFAGGGQRDHRRGGGGFIPGAVAGAVIGGALASQGGYYAPGYPGYYDSYGYYDEPYDDGVVAVAPGVAGGDDEGYCIQTYRSYDPASGTYLGYDGLRHPCP